MSFDKQASEDKYILLFNSYSLSGENTPYCSIPMDICSKYKIGQSSHEIFSRIEKPIISSFIESIIEFCRICFDLFPCDCNDLKRKPKISVQIPNTSIESSTKQEQKYQWNNTPQNIHYLLQWIRKHSIDTNNSNFFSYIENSIDILLECNNNDSKYLICYLYKEKMSDINPFIIYNESKSKDINIIEYIEDKLKHKNIHNNNKFEITIIYTCNECEEKIVSTSTDYVKANYIITETNNILNISHNLACWYFNLNTLRITGIPMKTESGKNKNKTTYDVLLLHPQDYNKNNIKKKDLASSLNSIEENKITLQWKLDKSFNKSSFTCSNIHRLTPVSLFSSPTQCLIRYLISEKPVTLIQKQDNNNNSLIITHLIILQGKHMFLHSLNNPYSFPKHPNFKKFLDFYGNHDTNLRTTAFSELLQKNILHPRPSNEEKQDFITCNLSDLEPNYHNITTTPHLIENTMWFPYNIQNTIIKQNHVSQDLNFMLGTLYTLFTSASIQQKDITTGLDYLQKLYKAFQINDSIYFPSTSTSNRHKCYQVLWNELLTLGRRSKKFYKDSKSCELSNYIETLFTNNTSNINSDTTPIIHRIQTTKSGSNSGDLTHCGSTLEQEKQKRSFSLSTRNPFSSTPKNSLFSTFWNSKIDNISSSKRFL